MPIFSSYPLGAQVNSLPVSTSIWGSTTLLDLSPMSAISQLVENVPMLNSIIRTTSVKDETVTFGSPIIHLAAHETP